MAHAPAHKSVRIRRNGKELYFVQTEDIATGATNFFIASVLSHAEAVAYCEDAENRVVSCEPLRPAHIEEHFEGLAYICNI